MAERNWNERPRKVSVVVDNDSWIIPYAQRLITDLKNSGDDAVFCREYSDIATGHVAFYLGCTKITPPEVLVKNKYNLVVHQSDLPRGRGFSPMTWQILQGRNEIPVCLFEMVEQVDQGDIIYRDSIRLQGHELVKEWQEASGEMSLKLCKRFMNDSEPHPREKQTGVPSWYNRRRPKDSELDPSKSIAEQFDLLRVVDNERYPAFFRHRGHTYRIKIEKLKE